VCFDKKLLIKIDRIERKNKKGKIPIWRRWWRAIGHATMKLFLSVFKKNLASGSPLAVRPLTDACTLN